MRDAQMGRIKNNLGVAELMLHYCLFFFLHNSFTGKAQRERKTLTQKDLLAVVHSPNANISQVTLAKPDYWNLV